MSSAGSRTIAADTSLRDEPLHRQLQKCDRRLGKREEKAVEALVERRAGHGMGSQLPERIPLVIAHSIGRPTLPGTQLPAEDEIADNET